MNDKHTDKQQLDSNQLENLFAQAREQQTPLAGDEFTASVMRRLSADKRTAILSTPRRAWRWLDAVGLGLGTAACFSFVQPTELLLWVSNALLPETVVISPLSILAATGTLGLLAISAWWATEGQSRI
ncbi:MAG: hypothetical protein HKN50_03855 [Gammaproteobacteria bacterium]|nr:hypothetical protein [Gammaproteobacteria bacterium]